MSNILNRQKPYKIARGRHFFFAIETAMRAGEIASLTWNNINFEKRTAFCQLLKMDIQARCLFR